MVIKNHIAWPLLMDELYRWDWIKTQMPHLEPLLNSNIPLDRIVDDKLKSVWKLWEPKGNTLYMVTETVLDKLDLLKVKKVHTEGVGEHYNWTVFNHIPDNKKTFILPDLPPGHQNCLRLLKSGDVIQFLHLSRFKNKDNKNEWNEHAICFFVDTKTGLQCDHFNHIDVKGIEDFIYRLLCFIWLSENEEIIVKPGQKVGTRNSGKLINSFDKLPITIINSKWNVTSVRTEGFQVRGHFRVLTKGHIEPRMVWIEPYEKKGYIRKAKAMNIS